MSRRARINRTRRSLISAAGLAATVVLASTLSGKQAGAYPPPPPPHGGGGHCFLRGTRIHSANGYKAIETLVTGDEVAARFAGVVPIKAIDSFILRRVDGEWTGPSRPVRVKRGALGDGRPATDLCLTASHAIFVDGFLVPVGDLVNGTSIVFETAERQEVLEFFHIELPTHDVIDAEGLPCESLRRFGMMGCVPLHYFAGRRGKLLSRLRSAASLFVERRLPIDIVRDSLEERGALLAGRQANWKEHPRHACQAL